MNSNLMTGFALVAVFAVTFPASAPKGTTFNDFSLETPPLKR